MKTVVITGSTRGIGFGIALRFLENGHNVVINGTTSQSVDKSMQKLKLFGDRVFGVPGVVEKESTHHELFDAASRQFGNVDIWINNAGINQPNKFAWELEHEDISALVSVNIEGVMLGSAIAYRRMESQGHGKIFNMEGLGSDGRMIPKTALYGTSKRAVNYYTKAFSREVRGSCVQVGIISPGMVVTDFLDKSMTGTPEEIEQYKKVFNFLGNSVDEVTPFIYRKLVKSKKQYDRIEWLTGARLLGKLVRWLFVKDNYFD
jgi:NAD(P)-dependent dehydrogenase (short-subunit alcohol dehydrogenase family)